MKGDWTDFGTAGVSPAKRPPLAAPTALVTARTTNPARPTWNKGRGKVPVVAVGAVPDVLSVTVTVPIQTVSRSNEHGKIRVAAGRARRERDAVAIAFLEAKQEGRWEDDLRAAFVAGCVVRLTRVSPRLLDSDNVQAALKSIRDQVAVELLGGRPGERDQDPAIAWEYGQLQSKRIKGKPVYGVVVGITTGGGG